MDGDLSGSCTPHPEWRSVIDKFLINTRRVPSRRAVETLNETRTFAQLAVRVEQLAGHLARKIRYERPLIAVCLDRDVDLPAWLLAVLRVGGAYLPLDPAQPAARLRQVLDDAMPVLIVASRSKLRSLPVSKVPILIADEIEGDAGRAPAIAITPDSLAYIIYTSGSTGRPKGVEIEHGALSQLLATMAHSPGFADGQRMLSITRISFDLSVPDMFLPFVVGGTLALVELDVAGDPDRLASAFTRFRPDLVQGTPSVWRGMIEGGWGGQPKLRLLAGGEPMTLDLASRLLPLCGELWNMYGPTEATVWATACRVLEPTAAVSVGWAMDGVTVQVTDEYLQARARGEVGEIVIGGAGVARGYRNRPELTAERFVRLQSGERVYRTGDLGRVGCNGELYCLGRLDDQVKIRGFRVELGDVEAALAAHPSVAWGAARLCSNPVGESSLVGYVVARRGRSPSASDIKASMALAVPAYMVPDRIVVIPKMPLTPNGKVDRSVLPSPFEDIAPFACSSDGPVSERLAEIWRDLLGINNIKPDDDFFELGGYSLMTVRLARRVELTFGVKLALIDLMRCSTLTKMAARIEEGGQASSETIVLLNAGGDRPPIYWLDAGPLIRTMALQLPAGQPALTLNLTPGVESALGTRDLRIENIASQLREQLIAHQPTGSLRLGGWCRWGIVALELARQLREEGRVVALVVLLDADCPGSKPSLRACLANLFRPLYRTFERPSFSERVAKAAERHRPKRYDGEVLLVRPYCAAGDGGWGALIPSGLTICNTGGDHETMIRHPHVHSVATAIGFILAAGTAKL